MTIATTDHAAADHAAEGHAAAGHAAAGHAAAARAIACFAALHCPDGTLSSSADALDYSRDGKAIVANLRDIAQLIKQASRILH